VQPPPATTLADGMTVVVSPSPGADPFGAFAYGPPSDVGVWVMEGMSEWSFGKATNSFAEASVSAPSVGLSPVVSVRAVVSGKVHDVLTNAGTTGELLSAMGIKPDADDRVLPSPSTPLHAGGSVRFDRVRIVTRVVHLSVPFDVHTRFTSALAPGTVQVLRQGAPGERVVQLRLTLVNGHVAVRQVLQSWFTHRPIPEERLSGPAPADGGTLDGSGSTEHRQFGEATWYDPPWSGLTAAHPWLPFGTRVTVTDLETGRSVSVIINDRGPFAAGRIIDLSPEAFSRLQPLGRGVLDVRITW
jgi:rare lipoprotein A